MRPFYYVNAFVCLVASFAYFAMVAGADTSHAHMDPLLHTLQSEHTCAHTYAHTYTHTSIHTYMHVHARIKLDMLAEDEKKRVDENLAQKRLWANLHAHSRRQHQAWGGRRSWAAGSFSMFGTSTGA